MEMTKEPHTAVFVAPTGIGKTHLALDCLAKKCKNYFEFFTIICPTLKHNETYRRQKWFWNNPKVILIEPGNSLYYWIENMSNFSAELKTLFLIDDIIADKNLDKKDNLCWN